MFDKEIEAIAKCTELIKDLDDKSKIRVIKYLVERFDIGMQKTDTIESITQNSEITETEYLEENENEIISEDNSKSKYPILKDIVLKDLPNSETEWVLVYGFYSSEYGNDFFTRKDILNKYDETNRKTDNRRKNLSQSFKNCIKNDWIKSHNDNEYLITSKGSKYCNNIFKR